MGDYEFDIACSYLGSKINLYNEGANEIFDEINDKHSDERFDGDHGREKLFR